MRNGFLSLFGCATAILCLTVCGCNLSAARPKAGEIPAPSLEPPATADPGEAPLPDISSFAENPTARFFLDAAGMETVSRTHPFIGKDAGCAHAGAHSHFRGAESSCTVDLYAPADGIIRMVTPCLNVGPADCYGFSLEFARAGNDPLVFNFSTGPPGRDTVRRRSGRI